MRSGVKVVDPRDTPLVNKVRDAIRADYAGLRDGAADFDLDVYLYGPGCVRVRVVDRAFTGMENINRHGLIWKVLERNLKPGELSNVTVLLLLAPRERRGSTMSRDFDETVLMDGFSPPRVLSPGTC